MTTPSTSPILQQIRRMAEDEHTKRLSDQELLAQFNGNGDDAAFQALVRRHGPMALDVCRAVLANEADAEDAFQATFLVLARKALSIRKTASLASWLHGVAYRIALDARRKLATRSKHETRASAREGSDSDDLTWREAQHILHEELSSLNARDRTPLVLCYLQGRTQDEAAGILGMAKSTLKMRLEKARELLRIRLVRRGLGPAYVLFAAAWPAAEAYASVPPALLAATCKAAVMVHAGHLLPTVAAPNVAALAEGVLHMTLRKLATAVAGVVVLIVFGLGSIWFVLQNQSSGGDSEIERRPAPENLLQKPLLHDGDINPLVEQLQALAARREVGEDELGIFLMDVGKSNVSLIAAKVDQERAYCGSPCWSSDGRSILFDGSPGKKFDNSRLQKLELTKDGLGTNSLGAGNCPTISPDGKHVAYLVNRGTAIDAEPGIWVMNADGTARRRLGGHGIPKWSPDGQRLLVTSFTTPCKLSLLDVQTGEERPVEFGKHQVYSVPSWVADATFVAIVRADKGVSIALVEVTDRGDAKVKETLWTRGDHLNVEPIYPVYSPRTKRCVFVGRDKQGQALYGFEHGKGEAPKRLEAGETDRKIASLALSPDGRYLVFCSDRPWPRLPAIDGRGQ